MLHKRVTVMGLGRHGGGVAAARYLAEQGARVTVTDLADEQALAASLAQLNDVGVERFTLGRHVANDFTAADTVVVNPAVRPDDRWVRLAREAGVAITSEIELFLRACPATVIGVTGSNGKSTTAAMTADCLRAAGRRAFLGGNIGRSLLPLVHSLRADDLVVLELSSFQLAWLNDDSPRPEIAAITNFARNHLDWHGTVDSYRAAKQRIADRSWSKRIVLGPLDETWHCWAHAQAEEVVTVVPDDLPKLRLPGKHNRRNAALAVEVASAAGCDRQAALAAITEFAGLPHRLEMIGTADRRKFINDSQATTPEATIAALQSLDAPLRLLVGGGDKGADWRGLARMIVRHAASAACYGQTGETIRASILAERA
ncbi:MAG: UDP-N-acetylmuramoyl-L-alanine--D-glutamate ligase, partial [Pirellulales bacterium]